MVDRLRRHRRTTSLVGACCLGLVLLSGCDAWTGTLTPASLKASDSAGQEWVKLDSEGRGTVTGWTTGSYSGPTEGDVPDGVPKYAFQVANTGLVGGLRSRMTIEIGANDSTEFIVDTKRVEGSIGKSAADIVFGDENMNSSPVADGTAKVVVEVHHEGDRFIADKVVATSDDDAPLE